MAQLPKRSSGPALPAIAAALNLGDPGDATQRNFRYQHAYGVVLILAATTGSREYVAIWCEHHEDFLAERPDGLFDAYQVKTRKPEIGAWELTDTALMDSIRRFVQLMTRFPGAIHSFFFVSNAECSDSTARASLGKSPQQLRRKVLECDSAHELPQHFQQAVATLAAHCGCTTDEVFSCLKLLEYIRGPGRDSFEAELSHNAVSAVPRWDRLSRSELNLVRDALLQLVAKASALSVDSPERFVCPLDATDRRNPALLAKRLEPSVVVDTIVIGAPFRFLPEETSLELGSTGGESHRRYRKLLAGGLGAYSGMLESRALATERHLIEQQLIDATEARALLNQVEHVVYGECLEAHNQACLDAEPFGLRMLADVNQRLRSLASERPEMVHNAPFELLSGVAMLLTGACKVWWSPTFTMDAEQ